VTGAVRPWDIAQSAWPAGRAEALFSIIVPVFDPLDRFVPAGVPEQLVAGVLSLEGDLELILVSNNASGSQTTAALRTLASHHPGILKVVEMGSNQGTSRGFNAGLAVASASSQYLVFMSTDAQVIDRQMLGKLCAAMEATPRLGILHPVSVYEDSEPYNHARRFGSRAYYSFLRGRRSARPELGEREAREVCMVVSRRRPTLRRRLATFPLTFAFLRREMVERIGSFDDGVERGCHENNDLAYRALLAGYDVARIDNVFVNHRRLLFRSLTVEPARQGSPPHGEAKVQSTAWWNQKWKRPYDELYARWRVGPLLFPLLRPYFWAKRIGARLRRWR